MTVFDIQNIEDCSWYRMFIFTNKIRGYAAWTRKKRKHEGWSSNNNKMLARYRLTSRKADRVAGKGHLYWEGATVNRQKLGMSGRKKKNTTEKEKVAAIANNLTAAIYDASMNKIILTYSVAWTWLAFTLTEIIRSKSELLLNQKWASLGLTLPHASWPSISPPPCLSRSLSLSCSVRLSTRPFLSRPVCSCLSRSVYLSLAHFICLSLSFCLSIHLSTSLSLSVSLSLKDTVLAVTLKHECRL